ncbi:ABC transporter permease [Luteipulveratus mongoliensis]|uniref:ABC3 transporter permease C-terminal domain-containing protein n=1 Tax=Luteipulveratus mongoliensis TaxID=571913 RepID=A0A0K1JF37_9MICO|nr:ABC transporter permease [Luteipulveratus mongoliensis]AKU15337.1 hypothetical protein VV02_04775 [Luteipulveratus mongoliensis]
MSWWGSWRLMLRLAHRDARRQWGRSLLVALLVGLPVMVVAAGGTLLFTRDATQRELLSSTVGSSQARVKQATTYRTIQNADGSIEAPFPLTGTPQRAIAIPGAAVDKPLTPAALQSVTGGHVVPITRTDARVTLGERRPSVTILGADGRATAYHGITALKSGRWPTGPNEVVVTPAGRRLGIPTSGTLTLSVNGVSEQVRVVGQATSPRGQALVALPRSEAMVSTEYLLDRRTPVTWAEVQHLNAYGLVVISRHMVLHPGTATGPELAELQKMNGGGNNSLVTLVLTGLVVLTVLMAGPAFTATAQRQRHALGQVGSNGGTAAMLRRYVLARAIVLGALSATLGVLIGAPLGILAVKIVQRWRPDSVWGPLDLRWSYGLGLILVGVLTSLVSAMIPAVAASRISLIQVLRGQVSARRARAGWPVLGLVIAVVASIVLIASIKGGGSEIRAAAAGFALFAGAVMCLPWLLSMLGHLAGRLPIATRLATRDVSRQRGRAASGVAAIMASVAVMTALAISGTSDDSQERRDYIPITPIGEGYASGPPSALREIQQIAHVRAPSVRTDVISDIGDDAAEREKSFAQSNESASTLTIIAPQARLAMAQVQPGCTPRQSVGNGSPSCRGASSTGMTERSISVMPARVADSYLGLSSEQIRELDDGAVLAVHDPRTSQPYPAKMTFAIGRTAFDTVGDVTSFTVTRQVQMPAIHVNATARTPNLALGWGVIMTPATAARLKVPTTASSLAVWAPGGVTSADEAAMADRLPDHSNLSIEHGYTSETTKVIRIMLICLGLITLLVTLISTALTQAESKPDQATLSAIGASSRLRRRVAGAQAGVIALVGGLVGLVEGTVPGVAATYPLTESHLSDSVGAGSVLKIPWLELAGVVVGVPLLAAVLATLAVRSRPPSLTRRID